MLILTVIAFVVLIAGGFAIYLLQNQPSAKALDNHATTRSFEGLFPEQNAATESERAPDRKAELVARAGAGDLDSLSEASLARDCALYHDVLDALIESTSGSAEKFRALVQTISNGPELRGNKKLAARVMEEWKTNQDKSSTIQMAHIAALSDDAATYEKAVELIGSAWKQGRLPRFSRDEVIALFESQYWILTPEARRAGAGFALKTRLSELRRELAATIPARETQSR